MFPDNKIRKIISVSKHIHTQEVLKPAQIVHINSMM